jgi:proteic killer suppression protein
LKHKGLKRLFETGQISGVTPHDIEARRTIPALIETSETIDDMHLPGLVLYNLKGKRKNRAVTVGGNWRGTFKLENGDILEVAYEDYH